MGTRKGNPTSHLRASLPRGQRAGTNRLGWEVGTGGGSRPADKGDLSKLFRKEPLGAAGVLNRVSLAASILIPPASPVLHPESPGQPPAEQRGGE